jgi:hypothetical protein
MMCASHTLVMTISQPVAGSLVRLMVSTPSAPLAVAGVVGRRLAPFSLERRQDLK